MGDSQENKRRRPKAGIRQWVYAILCCLCCIAFVIWTGYYAVLILIPVFIDIYITKYINWGGWKQSKNPTMQKILDWVYDILFALVGVSIITTFFFQNYQIPTSSLEKSLLVGDFLCVNKLSYGARSPMTPLSLPLMQHTIPGLDIKSYSEKPQLKYQRFAGLGKVERYDIVVFNYPSGDTVATKRQNEDYYVICHSEGRDNVWNNKNIYGDIVYRPVDRRENYVKRCVGLPGETIEVRNDTTFIDGKPLTNPENMQLLYMVQTDGTVIAPSVFDELGISMEDRAKIKVEDIARADSTSAVNLGLSYNGGKPGLLYSNVNLTKGMVDQLKKKPFVTTIIKRNEYWKRAGGVTDLVYPVSYSRECAVGAFPATWIPQKGATITFDTDVDYKVAVYQRCIKNYEHNDFEYRDGKVYINGQQSDSYTFQYDYYFMMGDNRDNSADSRTWGFVPEDHIVGQPMLIWLSLDKDKGWFNGKIRWNRLFSKGNKNK